MLQRFDALESDSPETAALRKLLARSMLLHNEEWNSANDCESSKITHENIVRANELNRGIESDSG